MRRIVVLLAVCAALAVTGSAGAATFSLYAGEQAPAPAGVPAQATLNGFYPGQAHGPRRRQREDHEHDLPHGDVRQRSESGHGGTAVPPRSCRRHVRRHAQRLRRNPWYFEPLTKFIYNVGAFGPSGDRVIDDKLVHNSGALSPDQNGKPGTYTFEFPRIGTYQLVCLLHPGMQGTVVVKRKKANVARPAVQRAKANSADRGRLGAGEGSGRHAGPAEHGLHGRRRQGDAARHAACHADGARRNGRRLRQRLPERAAQRALPPRPGGRRLVPGPSTRRPT